MPRATADAAGGGGGGAAATAASGSGMESNIKAAAHVPLAVFSKSSSLMSDRASQAMEKALRHAPPAAPPRSAANFNFVSTSLSSHATAGVRGCVYCETPVLLEGAAAAGHPSCP